MRTRAGGDDIVVVIHGKAHPIQLQPLQPVATDHKTLKRFIGKHYAIYIAAVDQWLQFFSHLVFKETRDGRMIRMSLSRVKMKSCCNTPSPTYADGKKNKKSQHSPLASSRCVLLHAPPGGVCLVLSAFSSLWLYAHCRLAPISTTAERV